ncbi:hypothetical protein HYT25_04455 [Candidatus Pacearchaeota archaeon]|nr:hypothetical protein [Candidatus Pacearchaeota archaeon]
MKAVGKCPKCGKTITTNCGGCIEGNLYGCPENNEKMHKCKKKYDVIENIKWKKVPENEKELKEIEQI